MDVQLVKIGWNADHQPPGESADLRVMLDASGLGTICLAYESYLDAAREQERLSAISQPTEDDQRLYRDALEAVGKHLCSLGTFLLPVAKALAEAAPDIEVALKGALLYEQALQMRDVAQSDDTEQADAEVTAEAEAEDADPLTGYVPGKGSAYDYIPSWMEVPGYNQSRAKHDPPYAVIKLFTPDSDWTWFVLEYDWEDDIAFGLVKGFETELGDFSLAEMREVKGPWGLHIERDLWFRPTPVTELPEYREKWGEDGPYDEPGRRKEAARAQASPQEDEAQVERWVRSVNATAEAVDHSADPEGVAGGEHARLMNGYALLAQAGPEGMERLEELHRAGAATEEAAAALDVETPAALPGQAEPASEAEPETVTVDAETMARIEASYSADIISSESRVRKPVALNGRLWVCTGKGGATAWCNQVVPLEEYTGDDAWRPTKHEWGRGYAGRIVTSGGREYVMTEPRITVVTSDKTEPQRQIQPAGERQAPPGALRIGYYPNLDGGLVWTGDVQTFERYDGARSAQEAFAFLGALKAHLEGQGFAVRQVSKDFGGGTLAFVAGGPSQAAPGVVDGWRMTPTVIRVSDSERSLVAHLVQNCYAEPDVPEWHLPGLHLAQHIRTLLRQAYQGLAAGGQPVVWDDLWDRFDELARADALLALLGPAERPRSVLWAPERFAADLESEVIRPAAWMYVPPDERKLPKRLCGCSAQTLVEALAEAATQTRGKTQRINAILSTLADLGAPIPPEYISAQRAGAPEHTGAPEREAAQGQLEAAEEVPAETPAWQLTRREYQESKAITVAGGVPILNAADAKEHRRIVEQALMSGCPISTHVLKDYPDLWKPWTWPLEHWLQMEHNVQRTGPDMRYIAPTGDTVLWPGTNSREKAIRAQHRYEVERALQRGDPVPFRALAGYPDLPAPKPASDGLVPAGPRETPMARSRDTRPGADAQAGGEAPSGDGGNGSGKRREQRRKKPLPDGVPEEIEVDLGHFAGWKKAQVVRADGRWLYYRFPDDGEAMKKVQLQGRDILWRVPTPNAAAAA